MKYLKLMFFNLFFFGILPLVSMSDSSKPIARVPQSHKQRIMKKNSKEMQNAVTESDCERLDCLLTHSSVRDNIESFAGQGIGVAHANIIPIALRKRYQIIEDLLNLRVSINVPDKNGNTILDKCLFELVACYCRIWTAEIPLRQLESCLLHTHHMPHILTFLQKKQESILNLWPLPNEIE